MASTCRSCDAPIKWVATEPREDKPSRRMPLDATDDGEAAVVGDANLIIIGHDAEFTPIVRYVPKGRGTHVSHFATCPNRDEHRKR